MNRHAPRRAAATASVALAFALLQAAAMAATAPGASPAPSAAPWNWPTIPGCLADPEINVSGKRDFASPICAVYEDLLKSGATDIELESARHVNAQLGGVLYPAFVPGTEVVRFTVTPAFNATFERANRLVRVSETRTGAMYGSWWTTTAQLQDGSAALDAARIRAILALTYTPSCMAASTEVRPGVRAYMGVVAPAFDEPGGSVEFWFPPDAVVAGPVVDVPGSAGCTR